MKRSELIQLIKEEIQTILGDTTADDELINIIHEEINTWAFNQGYELNNGFDYKQGDIIRLKSDAEVNLSYKQGSPPKSFIKNSLWIIDDVDNDELNGGQMLNISTFEPEGNVNAGSYCSFVYSDDVLRKEQVFRNKLQNENIMNNLANDEILNLYQDKLRAYRKFPAMGSDARKMKAIKDVAKELHMKLSDLSKILKGEIRIDNNFANDPASKWLNTFLKESNIMKTSELRSLINEILSQIPSNSFKTNDKQILRTGILAEIDAVNLYEQLAGVAKNKKVKATLLDIAKEEKTHIGEFEALLLELDPEHAEELEKGKKETESLKENNMTYSKLTHIIKEEILNILNEKEGKCPKSGCTKKVGEKWRIISNRTGILWPQKYDTEDAAKTALNAYHFSRNK